MDAELLERIDLLVSNMSSRSPGPTWTRTAVIRMLLSQALEKEEKLLKKRRK
jgi:hypothetical protein